MYWYVLKMVALVGTWKGWRIKERKNIYQSHWTALIIFYTITSVTDQDEPSQIYLEPTSGKQAKVLRRPTGKG
jgi:hypothetical protein